MLLQLSIALGWAVLGFATANPQGFLTWGDRDSFNDKTEFGINPFERFIENMNNKIDGDVDASSEKSDPHMDCEENKEDTTTDYHGAVGKPIIAYFHNKNYFENSKEEQKTSNFPEKLLGVAVQFKRFPNRLEAEDVDETPTFPIRPFTISSSLFEDPELSRPTNYNPLGNLFSRLRLVGDNVPENLPKNLDADNESAPNKEYTKEDSKEDVREDTKEDTKGDTKDYSVNTFFNIKTLNLNTENTKGKSFVNAMLNNEMNGTPLSLQATFNIDTLNVGVYENTPSNDDSTLKNVDPPCGDSCNGDNAVANELGEKDGDRILPPKPEESDDVEAEPLQILKNMLIKEQNTQLDSDLDRYNIDYKKNDGVLIVRRKKFERRPILLQKDLDGEQRNMIAMLV